MKELELTMSLSKFTNQVFQALARATTPLSRKQGFFNLLVGKITIKNEHCLYSTAVPSIQKSPFKDLFIPDNVLLPHYVMKDFSKYGELTALVRSFVFN